MVLINILSTSNLVTSRRSVLLMTGSYKTITMPELVAFRIEAIVD
jgi:hypothetical protein